MGYVNAQIIVGRLGANPVFQKEDGIPACRFPVGTSLLYQKSGRTIRETEWHNVVVFGDKAKEAANQLRRGGEVFVKGPKRTMSYSNATNVPRIRVEIHAEQIKWRGTGKPGALASQIPTEIVIGDAPDDALQSNVEVQTGLRIEDLGSGIITPAGGVARSNAPGVNNRGQGVNASNNIGGLQFVDPDDEDDFIQGFVGGPVDELAELADLSARIGTGQDTFWGRKRAGEGESYPVTEDGMLS